MIKCTTANVVNGVSQDVTETPLDTLLVTKVLPQHHNNTLRCYYDTLKHVMGCSVSTHRVL